MNISDLNHRAGYHDVVPVQLDLKRGDVNTVRFGASGSSGKDNQPPAYCLPRQLMPHLSGFEVFVDGIELYEDE